LKKILIVFLLLITLTGCQEVTTTLSGVSDSYPATIRGRVMTDSGDMITAGIIITYENGDMERVNTNMLSGYTLKLYTGSYTLTFERGYEYQTKTISIDVENYKTYVIDDVRLTQLYDGPSKGMYLGDLHQHTLNSDGKQEVDEVLMSNINRGLYFGYLSDHNSAAGLPEWVQGNRFVAGYDVFGNAINFLALRAVEITTDYGHFQSIGVGNVFEQADINSLKGDDPVTEITDMVRETIRSGALAQINHPFAVSVLGFNYWEIIDEFDTIEIWNGLYQTNRNENLEAKLKWFDIINGYIVGENKFLPATGGSDNHNIEGTYNSAYKDTSTAEGLYKDQYLRRGVYTGMPATCVLIDGAFTEENIMNALKNGNSFITNGPMIEAKIGSSSYGETYHLVGASSIVIDLDVFSRDQIETINIYKNGVIVKTISIEDDSMYYSNQVQIEGLSDNDWIVIEVLGVETLYAITNPIFIKN
jgi:hypothetical protein